MAQDIVFAVNGTGLALTSAPGDITAGSLNANRCVFAFNGEWAEFNGRIAYFGTDRDRMMPVLLTISNSSYSCTVPAQVLQALSTGGKMYISVGGSKANEETLRTKLYALTISDSGEAEIYITREERDQFLIDASAAIATLEGKSIQSVVINDSHEMVITMENGTVYNLGNVKGAKGDKGDKGDTGATGATGAHGLPGVPGADGEDGVSITGVTASLDAQNRRVFTFTFSDGTSQAVIVPGEVITVTDEQGQDPQAMTVQAAVQSIANVSANLDERVSNNSTGIAALNTTKADKTALVYECDVQMQGDDIYIMQEDIDALYRLKPAFLKFNVYAEGVVVIKQIYYLISANNVPNMEYEGPLVYQVYNYDFSGTKNNYVRIEIPKNAANPLTVDEVTFQEKIDSNNKLSADVVDDTNTAHKFVSAAEKAVWNGKADKTVVTGTDGKRYTLCFTMSAGKPAIEYEEVVTNE